MSVFILVRIDDEYGHKNFLGVFRTRFLGTKFAWDNFGKYLEILGGLYESLEDFNARNGCEGYVLFEEEIKGE